MFPSIHFRIYRSPLVVAAADRGVGGDAVVVAVMSSECRSVKTKIRFCIRHHSQQHCRRRQRQHQKSHCKWFARSLPVVGHRPHGDAMQSAPSRLSWSVPVLSVVFRECVSPRSEIKSPEEEFLPCLARSASYACGSLKVGSFPVAVLGNAGCISTRWIPPGGLT